MAGVLKQRVAGAWVDIGGQPSSLRPPALLDSVTSQVSSGVITATAVGAAAALPGMAVAAYPLTLDRLIEVSFDIEVSASINTVGHQFTVAIVETTLGEASPKTVQRTWLPRGVTGSQSMPFSGKAEFQFTDLALYRAFQLYAFVSNAASSITMVANLGFDALMQMKEVVPA